MTCTKNQTFVDTSDASVLERRSICGECRHNKDGECLIVAMRNPGFANIDHGTLRPELKCPIGKWGKIKTDCATCGRVLQEVDLSGRCFWCRLKNNTNKRRSGSGSFTMSEKMEYVSTCDLQRDTLTLIGKIPPDVEAVVGVARSGMAVATMVAMMLHRPLYTLRQTQADIIECGNGWRLWGTENANPRKVVVVDDTVMTGNSMRHITPIVKNRFDEAIYTAVYVNPKASVKPQLWARDLGWPHLLEWNMFNSILSPNMALDFDGILCHDCPRGSDDDGERYLQFIQGATPKFIPRRMRIPLIVTARIEKYRELTMHWLARHGITVTTLVMHPAKTLAERQRDDIAAYKAMHFDAWAKFHHAKPQPAMFVESDDRQARQIANRTARLVVCPSSGKCYE